ncbi:MAG: alkaline phosphatase family protein [Caulobacteraceae bacterium]
MRLAAWFAAFSTVLGLMFAAPAAMAQTGVVPAYDHVFLIIEENHGLAQIIGNPAAPNMTALLHTYGLATSYFSTTDPSAPNYVAMLGGDAFGIADDNAYYLHLLDKPNLMSQLDQAGIPWKGYLQSMPHRGYLGLCFPGRCNGVPDVSALYGTKHNGLVYFRHNIATGAKRDKMAPITELAADLAAGPPRFRYIVPDHCTDMHGSPPWCGDSGNPGGKLDNVLVSRGNAYVAQLVAMITAAPFWPTGNNAIIITFDEGNGTGGCCDAIPGTGRVYTAVITSRGPRGLVDDTHYNHYSLLRTIETAFRVGCVGFACDTANVPVMTPLFAVGK